MMNCQIRPPFNLVSHRIFPCSDRSGWQLSDVLMVRKNTVVVAALAQAAREGQSDERNWQFQPD